VEMVCNQMGSEVKFHNVESPGNDCTAPGRGQCFSTGKRAFIPKCESGRDFPKHHFELQFSTGTTYAIWKKDGDGKIYGALNGNVDDACRGTVLADYSQGDYWAIVVKPDGSIQLSDGHNGCPPLPPVSDCSKIEKVTGAWVIVGSSNGSGQTYTYKQGTTRSYTNKDTQTWGSKVTTKVSAGFEAAGAKASVEVDVEMSTTLAHEYSSTFTSTAESDFTYSFDKAGVVWQWRFTVADPCGTSQAQRTDMRLTPAAVFPPCCLPGYERNLADPHGGGCYPDNHGKTVNLC
jgi:hypothetical protein